MQMGNFEGNLFESGGLVEPDFDELLSKSSKKRKIDEQEEDDDEGDQRC